MVNFRSDCQSNDEKPRNNIEAQKLAVKILADEFKNYLRQAIGSEQKSPMALVAWSKALLELEQELRFQLLQIPFPKIEELDK